MEKRSSDVLIITNRFSEGSASGVQQVGRVVYPGGDGGVRGRRQSTSGVPIRPSQTKRLEGSVELGYVETLYVLGALYC